MLWAPPSLPIQSAPGLKVGCDGPLRVSPQPLRDCYSVIAKEVRPERGCGVLAEVGCLWPMSQLSSNPPQLQEGTLHPSPLALAGLLA